MKTGKDEHFLSREDLTEIKRFAIEKFMEIGQLTTVEGKPILKDDELARTYAFVQAVSTFLNREGFTTHLIKIKP